MRNWEKELGVILAVLSFITLLCAVIYRPLIWIAFGIIILMIAYSFIEQYEEYLCAKSHQVFICLTNKFLRC